MITDEQLERGQGSGRLAFPGSPIYPTLLSLLDLYARGRAYITHTEKSQLLAQDLDVPDACVDVTPAFS